MSNILKSTRVNLVSDAVQIQDITPCFMPPQDGGRPAAEGFADMEMAPLQTDAATLNAHQTGAAGNNPTGNPGDAVSEQLIEDAKKEASDIIDDAMQAAEQQKQQLLQQAEQEMAAQKQQVLEETRAQGLAEGAQHMQTIVDELEQTVASLEGDQAGFEAEYEENLRWLALEIAAKVMAKKIRHDDTEMLEMVHEAVQEVRDEPWVRVEVSHTMTGLLEELMQLYQNETHIEVMPTEDSLGTARIESPSGVVDASLQTQLSNLKDYFEQAHPPQ